MQAFFFLEKKLCACVVICVSLSIHNNHQYDRSIDIKLLFYFRIYKFDVRKCQLTLRSYLVYKNYIKSRTYRKIENLWVILLITNLKNEGTKHEKLFI